MNDNLQKYNKKKKRDALAEKMILAMMQNGKWWQCLDSGKNALVKKAFEWADVFIAKQEEQR